MPRPQRQRIIGFDPAVTYFKPRGVPMRLLTEVELCSDELEAVRLHDIECFDQVVSAQKMGISQSTFARILDRAYKKIAQALIFGKAIKISR